MIQAVENSMCVTPQDKAAMNNNEHLVTFIDSYTVTRGYKIESVTEERDLLFSNLEVICQIARQKRFTVLWAGISFGKKENILSSAYASQSFLCFLRSGSQSMTSMRFCRRGLADICEDVTLIASLLIFPLCGVTAWVSNRTVSLLLLSACILILLIRSIHDLKHPV